MSSTNHKVYDKGGNYDSFQLVLVWVYGESKTSSWPNLSPNAQTTFFWFMQFSHVKHIQNRQKRHWMLVVTIQNQKSIYFLPSKTIYDNGYFDFFLLFPMCSPRFSWQHHIFITYVLPKVLIFSPL